MNNVDEKDVAALRGESVFAAPHVRGDEGGEAGSNGKRAGETSIPDPEVSALPKRRRFTADYKARVVEEAEGCIQPGGIGALLRREGIYS